MFKPRNELTLLGFILNSQKMLIRPKKERVEKTIGAIRKFKAKSKNTIRDFASIIGSIVSLLPGVRYYFPSLQGNGNE